MKNLLHLIKIFAFNSSTNIEKMFFNLNPKKPTKQTNLSVGLNG